MAKLRIGKRKLDRVDLCTEKTMELLSKIFEEDTSQLNKNGLAQVCFFEFLRDLATISSSLEEFRHFCRIFLWTLEKKFSNCRKEDESLFGLRLATWLEWFCIRPN